MTGERRARKGVEKFEGWRDIRRGNFKRDVTVKVNGEGVVGRV